MATAAADDRRRHTAEAGDFRLKPRLYHTRNRKFESISLQRRVTQTAAKLTSFMMILHLMAELAAIIP